MSAATTDGWKTGEDEALAQRALAEVEAIEKAAKTLAQEWDDLADHPSVGDMRDAKSTLGRIAKEAP
jgi:sensor domain CHASE-containing protein